MEPQETLERLIEEDLARVQAYYKTRDEEVPPGLLIDLNKDANLMRAMLEGYMQWVAETGVDADLIIVSSETYMEARFPVPTEQLPVFIIGKLDVKALRTTDRVRLFMDHKTVAAFAQKTRTVHMSPQMLHYHLLEWLNGTDTEERCDGALYNMIRRVKRSVTAKPPFYQRFPVMHNAHEIESYRKRLIGTITDILHVERALGDGYDHKYVAYSRPTEDCTWDCDFFLLCHRFDDGSRAEAMLADYFVRGDPLSYYAPNEKGGS